MRPCFFLIFSITVASIFAQARAESPASLERWEGYRSADSSEVQSLNLPFQDFAENAVLQIEIVGATRAAGEHFAVVDVNNEPVVTDNQILSSNLRLLQIETCRKQGLQMCPVLGYSNRGTAFFNRGRFLTCRHGFHNWIALASQLNGDISVRSISPPMILRNSKGEIVYNSASYTNGQTPIGEPQMEFSIINDDPRLNFQTHPLDYPSRLVRRSVSASDYVEFVINQKSVPDYELPERASGHANLEIGEETYLFGYPGYTEAFANRVGDTLGEKLVLSNGRANNSNRGILVTSNYASTGMSGGPVMTATSELVGVHCLGNSERESDPEMVQSYSFPIGSAYARKYWSAIEYPSESELATIRATLPTHGD